MSEPELESGHIRARTESQVLHVTLDRADKRNALTRAMYTDLRRCMDHAADSDDVRAVLIAGEGEMFCAGNDIADFANVDPHEREDGAAGPALAFIKAVRALDKPVVVAVQARRPASAPLCCCTRIWSSPPTVPASIRLHRPGAGARGRLQPAVAPARGPPERRPPAAGRRHPRRRRGRAHGPDRLPRAGDPARRARHGARRAARRQAAGSRAPDQTAHARGAGRRRRRSDRPRGESLRRAAGFR